jgi:hypothetical protein
MTRRCIGEYNFALGTAGKGITQLGIGSEPDGQVDVMHEIEVILGVDMVMTDQSSQGHAVIGPVAPPQGIDILTGDADHIAHIEIDPPIKQRKKVLLAGINRVIEIKNQNVSHKMLSVWQKQKLSM